MSRRTRHVHADHDEWIVVHRDPPSSGGCGCLLLLALLLVPGCAETVFSGPLGWILGLALLGLFANLHSRA